VGSVGRRFGSKEEHELTKYDDDDDVDAF